MRLYYKDTERQKYIIECERDEMPEELKKQCVWFKWIMAWTSRCKIGTNSLSERRFLNSLKENNFKEIPENTTCRKEELKEEKEKCLNY